MAFFSALNMWKPVERDSRLFKDCLGVPRNKPWKWPLIDVFICHYNEDCTQTMMTLQAAFVWRGPRIVVPFVYVLCACVPAALYGHGLA
jgi:hypothetical protein